MLAGAEDGGPGPSPRYFHAAAPLPARRAMLVLGGLTAAGVASDAWVLNLTTLQWRQEQVGTPAIRPRAEPLGWGGSMSPAAPPHTHTHTNPIPTRTRCCQRWRGTR